MKVTNYSGSPRLRMGFSATREIIAFTGPQVQRLAGLSEGRLAYWERTGVFRPAYVDDRPHRAHRRIYSFHDVVSLRTLVKLRDEFSVSLNELRETGRYLMEYVERPWTGRFWVLEGHVLFRHPTHDAVVDRQGQTTYVDMDEIRKEVERAAEQLGARDPADIGRIDRHRHVQHNRWVVRGTRVTTAAIARFHEAGYGVEQIVEQYPNLTIDDVEAAIAHEESAAAAAA